MYHIASFTTNNFNMHNKIVDTEISVVSCYQTVIHPGQLSLAILPWEAQ